MFWIGLFLLEESENRMILLATVSILWQWGVLVLGGFIIGVIASVKWISPPHDEINIETKFGTLVVKGKRHSTISDVLDVSDIADVSAITDKKLTRKERMVIRKKERVERKLKK